MTEYVRVPVEPTDKMRVAGAEANLAHEQLFPTDGIFRSTRIYTAMLAAAAPQADEMARLDEEPTDEQLADACLWYRHDFGLLPETERRTKMAIMRECWRAIWKAINTPGRGGDFAPSRKP